MRSTTDPVTDVVWLASTPGAAAVRLRVDARGHILQRDILEAASPAASATAVRTILLVPGTAAPAQWLELPAGSIAQARAAARIQLRERVAGDMGAVHVAVARMQDAGPAPVVVVASAAMDEWLRQAAALGLHPDAMVPDHLALPPPPATGADADPAGTTATVVALGGDWLVRTPTGAYRIEAELASALLTAPPPAVRDMDRIETLLARGALDAPLDLLQDRYAPGHARARGRRTWRRSALLAAALLCSVPLVSVVALARYAGLASAIEDRTAARIAAALPGAPALSADAVVHEVRTRTGARHGFAHATRALFAGVEALDGANVERLDWDAASGLRAGVAHRDAADLETLATIATGHGLRLTVAGSRAADGRLMSEVELQGAAP